MDMINVADLDARDGTGRSYREANNATQHAIPIGTLVEYQSCDTDYASVYDGIRAFVVKHTRDCDGTPLYSLCLDSNPSENNLFFKASHGFNGENLTVIRLAGQRE